MLMGIENIRVLIDPVMSKTNTGQQVAEAHIQALVEAHRRGQHPYESMRRDCPLCQSA